MICLDLFWTFCRSSFSIHGSEAKRYLQRWKFSNCGYFWSLRMIDMYSWTPGYFYLRVFLEIKISLPFHLQFLPSVTSNCQRNYLVRRNFVPYNQLLTTFFCWVGVTVYLASQNWKSDWEIRFWSLRKILLKILFFRFLSFSLFAWCVPLILTVGLIGLDVGLEKVLHLKNDKNYKDVDIEMLKFTFQYGLIYEVWILHICPPDHYCGWDNIENIPKVST